MKKSSKVTQSQSRLISVLRNFFERQKFSFTGDDYAIGCVPM